MSVQTLYSSVKLASEGDGTFDLLHSEVGEGISTKLGTVPKINALLGDSWTVSETTIPNQQVDREARQHQVPELITERPRPQRIRDPISGTVKMKVFSQTVPAQVVFRTQTYYLNVLKWFILDGKIGEDIKIFGNFWDDHGTLKYHLILEFPNTFVDTFFEYAYWPERTDCSITRPRLLVFSHKTLATYHMDWEAGVYFLMDLKLGTNLKTAAGNPSDPLFFGGPVGVKDDQFTFDFFSWPFVTMKFDGGKVEIEKVRLFAKTEDWSDGEVPRTIEGDSEEEPVEDEAPDPHEVQFSFQGFLKVKDTFKPKVWTPLPADTGVICWNLSDPGTQKLPAPKDLNALLGDQAWAASFGTQLDNWDLKELDLTAQLPNRKLSSASYTLGGSINISGAAPSPLTLAEAEVRCIIVEPASTSGSRQEVVEITGSVTVDGATFEAHLTLPETILRLASIDGEGFDKWSLSPWYKKRLLSGLFQNSDIEGVYDSLHVRVDFNLKKFWASVSNVNGASRDL